MASQAGIFKVLAESAGPLGRDEIGDLVGESYRTFQTQPNRWLAQGLLDDIGDHHYMLTDKGRETFKTLGKAGAASPGQFYLGVRQQDLDQLSDEEFRSVWEALGKIIRGRL